MNHVYDCLTSRADYLRSLNVSSGCSKFRRTIVALAGPPGSGKSTIAEEVVRRLNQSPKNGRAVVLPMDGFHLARAMLCAMPNHEEAFARRGIYWTFDGEGVVQLVRALHKTRTDPSVVHLAPCFDHAIKDPVENAIEITPDITFVIIEGNWLLFNERPWSNISQMVDDTWFVDVDQTLAVPRIAKRHLLCDVETSWEASVQRARNNDMVNGDLVRQKLVTPKIKVQSVEISNDIE